MILDGLVFMKSHTQDVVPPIMHAKYIQGDIIGFDKTDGGVSSRVETWCIAHAPTEVAVFSKEDFEVTIKALTVSIVRVGLAQTQQERDAREHAAISRLLWWRQRTDTLPSCL